MEFEEEETDNRKNNKIDLDEDLFNLFFKFKDFNEMDED
jgi:hypothetical protein